MAVFHESHALSCGIMERIFPLTLLESGMNTKFLYTSVLTT